MSARVFALSALLVALAPAQAAISITDPTSYSYSQTFDTLASSGSGLTLPASLAGWGLYLANGASATYAANTGSSNSGSFYSYGNSSDRALGALGSSGTFWNGVANDAVAGYITLSLSNDSQATITSFSLSFDGEQWRNGGSTAQSMVLEYGYGATFGAVTTWSTAPDFTWSSAVNGGTAGAINGNTVGLSAVSGTLSVDWQSGSTLWLRWVEKNDQGIDHGLAIDNVQITSVSAVPEPSSYAMLLAGLGTVGFVARRRRK